MPSNKLERLPSAFQPAPVPFQKHLEILLRGCEQANYMKSAEKNSKTVLDTTMHCRWSIIRDSNAPFPCPFPHCACSPSHGADPSTSQPDRPFQSIQREWHWLKSLGVSLGAPAGSTQPWDGSGPTAHVGIHCAHSARAGGSGRLNGQEPIPAWPTSGLGDVHASAKPSRIPSRR